MNRIEKLIKEKCPNGVEFTKLEYVSEIIQGFAFKNSTFKKTGIGVLRTTNIQEGFVSETGMVYIDPVDYKNDLTNFLVKKNNILIGMSGSIKVGINTNNTEYYLNQRVSMLKPKDNILNNFLYHYLKETIEDLINTTSGSSVKNLSVLSLKNHKIPILPLEIQEEIVKILDKFSELEAELEAELELRVKQYEFWRGKLLNNRTNLQALGKLLDYIQPTKYIVTNTQYDDTYETPVLTAGKTLLLGYTDDTTGIFKASKNNEVIIFDDFTTSNHWIDFNFKVKSSAMKMLVPRNQENHFKYIYYNIENIKYKPMTHARQWIQTYSKFEIPLPSYKKQVLIAKQLDHFNDLIKNMKYGLPAEIELRKKQYEYYRNKLLTLEEEK